MALEVIFSDVNCRHGLMTAIIADGVGNCYEKFMTVDEVSIVSRGFDSFELIRRPPRDIVIISHDELVDCSSVLDYWNDFLAIEIKLGGSKFSGDDKEYYLTVYNLLRERNNWTEGYLAKFTQTAIYIEPEFDW